jgi:cytochrome c-type biogenesis protein CcmF
MVVLSIVFTGTLFPLVMDAFGGPRVSVGPPYFNLSAAPFGVLLLLLMAIGTVVRWKRHPAAELVRAHRATLVAAVALCALSVAVQTGEPGVLSTLALFAAWAVAVGHLRDLAAKVGSARAGWLAGVRRLSRSYVGMTIAHLGLAASVAGMALVSTGESARDVRMVVGDAVELGDYRYELTALHAVTGPNYRATRADVRISRGGKVVGSVHPEKRTYNVQRNVMTEAGIDWGLLRDHYVALGESLGEGAWAVRVQQKPFMRWVWLGSVLMAIGGTLAISDRRYRLARRRDTAVVPGTEVAS